MPFEWNGYIAVTIDEIVPKLIRSPQTLNSILYRYENKPVGMKRLQRGGNGRPLLIDFDSLSHQFQTIIGDPRQVSHPLEKHYRMDNEAVVFFTKCQLTDGSYLNSDYQDDYITNASVLKAVIGFREDIIKERTKKALNKFGINAILCDHVKSFQKTLQVKHKSEHTLPEGEKRFKQVLKDFENKGYESLISGKLGNSNSRKVFENTMALLESMFARYKGKPTSTEVYRLYNDFICGKNEVINNSTGEVYDPKDFKKLSDTTVKKQLAKWDTQIGTHAIRGGNSQVYRANFIPGHGLERPKFSNSIISIDDRQPPFLTHARERIWFYNGIDLCSEVFTCAVYGKSKEGIIKEFYRQLVRNYAGWGLSLPAELEAEMSLNASFTKSFLREGAMFQYVRIEANNARGKKIERYFGNLRYGVEKNYLEWVARPFARSESNQSGTHEVPTMHADDIAQRCLSDLETWNNMPHSVFKDMSRWDVFMQKQHPDLQPINYNSFLFDLGYKTETSCNAGSIKLQGGEYLLGNEAEICTGERLISLMKRVEGQNVQVYWLDGNDGKVLKALVYMGSALICEAIAKPTYNRARIEQTDLDDANREIMSKYTTTIRAYGQSRKKAIEPVSIIDNTPAPDKKFLMPGLKQRAASREDSEPEILPEPAKNEFINLPETSNRKSFKDRF